MKLRLILDVLTKEDDVPGSLEITLYDDALARPLYDYFTAHEIPCELVTTNEIVERNPAASNLLGSLGTSERRNEHG